MAATSACRLAGSVPVAVNELTTSGVKAATRVLACSAETTWPTVAAAWVTAGGTVPVADMLDNPVLTAAVAVEVFTEEAVVDTASGGVIVTSGSFSVKARKRVREWR